VGDAGTIVENDGGGWQLVLSPSTAGLRSVWALDTGEAYAVGVNGEVLHRQTGVWSRETPFTSATLSGVWADKPYDWFAVGDGGEIWQNRGTGWLPMLSPRRDDLFDVFGSDSAFVFAVGEMDSLLFYDQVQWQPLLPIPTERYHAIWATICPLTAAAATAALSPRERALHCSNTYFAGTEGTVARVTLLGTYEILAGPHRGTAFPGVVPAR
jgi:hypothetical protein